MRHVSDTFAMSIFLELETFVVCRLSFVASTHIYFITVDDKGDTYQEWEWGFSGRRWVGGCICIPVFSPMGGG